MKTERSAVQDRPVALSGRRLTSILSRVQRPGATHRDEVQSPLASIEAIATRTVAESWGCWS
jgi:hypothetical protein